MAVNWDLYETRINTDGSTERDRNILRLKTSISKNAVNSPSYKEVYINGTKSYLVIDSTQDPYIKTFCCLPDKTIINGSYIKFQNKDWLVTSSDPDDEIYVDGKLQYCNYNLKFLNASSTVISRKCVVENATRYNSGIKEDKIMTLGAGQYLLKMPLDTDTINIDRSYSDGKDRRLLMDINTTEPIAYRITHVDRVTYPGLVLLTLVETERSEDDNLSLMVADYYSRIAPIPSEDDVIITYGGLPFLEVGKGFKTFVCQSDVLFSPIWTVVTPDEKYDGYVITEQDDDYIKIKVTNTIMIGMPITLQVKNADNTLNTSLELKVVGI